jgi:phytoene/squalene synthetase
MNTNPASSITKAASKQTYYTIRFLVDRERVEDAYRAYGYFRWVDDVLDSDSGSASERTAFLERQKSLLEECYQGQPPRDVDFEEEMLVELVEHDQEKNSALRHRSCREARRHAGARRQAQDSGLQSYLRNMMLVMDFDARRRGRLISQAELTGYTGWLATAVTEAMHYFIGRGSYTPHDESRYLAVTAAHITHMLRDTVDDVRAGYYNIPREVLEANRIGPQDVHSQAYRLWVKSRVELAHAYFEAGRVYFRHLQNSLLRLVGFAYMARFEWLLDTFERESFTLRPQYNERKSFGTGLRMSWVTLSSMISLRGAGALSQPAVSHQPGKS